MGRPSDFTQEIADARLPAIYGLYSPDGELLYVGKANDPVSRLKSHLRDARRRRTPLCLWIRKHGTPQMRVLRENCIDWRSDEISMIAEGRARGLCRLNVADGGDEPMCPHEVRVANARKVSKSRPQGVMRAYRTLEYTIRTAKRLFPHKVPHYEAKLEQFRAAIQRHRVSGTLAIVDARFVERFKAKPAESWS